MGARYAKPKTPESGGRGDFLGIPTWREPALVSFSPVAGFVLAAMVGPTPGQLLRADSRFHLGRDDSTSCLGEHAAPAAAGSSR